ncbi:MAG: C4-dicarboxylate ABC transporter substrate-binding protein [Burkholderiales bacterium]|nr:MAG: C4-dicarboxylate ABC transporter substrate-binding protein [Burkholderiales bacterium]
MKKKWAVAALLAALGQLCLAQTPTQWQLATGYRAESFHTRNLSAFALDVEKVSQGALQIQVRPNNELFKLAEIRQSVQDGRVQAGEVIMTGLVGEVPIAGADTIPFVVQSYGDARRLWGLQRPLIEKHLAERGLKVLYAVPWPPQGLFTGAPVRSMTDLKGSRMRTYNLSTQRIAQMLGASPVDVPMAEVNQALSEGRVDNMITSAVTGVENKVWGRIGHYYPINAWFPKNLVFVNVKAFEALPIPVREAVTQAAARAEARGWTMSETVATESTRELAAQGMKGERIAPAVEAELKRLGEKFSREWVQSVGHEANVIFVPYYFQR